MTTTKIMSDSEYHQSIIIALGVVEGQSVKLIDSEANIWESSSKEYDGLTIMTITKNGKIAYKEVHNCETSQTEEFFY